MRAYVLMWMLCLSTTYVHAETWVFDRVVPNGAQLTYSENGVVVRTIEPPAGRVHVIVTTGGGEPPSHYRPSHRPESGRSRR
jgi:hypothetical protein